MNYALILLTAAAFIGGWQVRDGQAQRAMTQVQAIHLQQQAAAQQQTRQREQVLQQKMEVLQHETQQQLAEISALERAAADSRVRELAKTYATGHRTGTDSPAAAHCPAERNRARMLADLLTELDQLAQQFAATADRNRIRGLACENAYKTVQSR